MNPRLLLAAAFVSPVSLAMVLHSDVMAPITRLEYSPRRGEYLAHPWMLWINLGTNLLVIISYVLFIAGIAWLVRKLKHIPDLRRSLWIFWALNAFFFARCVLGTLKFWWPLYNLSFVLNIVCAVTSIPAAAAFVWHAPALVASIDHFFHLLATEQSRAMTLRTSEAFLDRTNRLAGVGGWEIDLSTAKVTWSAETKRILGAPAAFEPSLAMGLDMYKPHARPIIVSAVETASAGGEGFDLELPVDCLDGREIWARVVGIVESREGTPVRLTGAFQDVTERVQARDALKNANERFALAADSGGIGIFTWDVDRDLCTCDPWMYRLHDLEQTCESTPLEFWTQHMHPDDRHLVLKALNEALEGPAPYNTEYRVIWNDGSVHHLRGTGKVTRDPVGRAIRMTGANWDVSESRRLTAQLAEQHELLHITLQSIGDGVITTDGDRCVAWLNPAAERMTGWATVDAIGRPINDIFQTLNEDTREATENPLANYIAQGKAVGIACHTLLISRDGTEFGIENAVAPIRNTFGDLMGNVLVFRDVTEQRRLAAETERNAQLNIQLRLKDDFLSHVSHELRSPLSSIYSFTSIIADGLAGASSSEQSDYLHIILKNVSQLQSMIEDLLTVTQSKEGKLTVELESVSVPDAVIDAIHTVQGAAAFKDISLASDSLDQIPPAFADPIRLQQVLIILLDNAIKFTPAGGKVTVSASLREPGLVTFRVSDTGCGIPADKRTLVFENLYQIRGPEQADTSNLGRTGLGLGLHIARNLVTRQGGNIWVTEAAGGGSTFNFTLPVFNEAACLAAPARSKQENPRRGNEYIPLQVGKPTLAA